MTQPTAVEEKPMLVSYLEAQRQHVLGILEGLLNEDMNRAVLPSGWTPASLVNHLAIDVERFWFRAVLAGDSGVLESGAEDDDAWKDVGEIPASDIVELYRGEIERSNAIIASTSLETPPAWWPEFFPNFRLDNLRDILLHVIAETACHAGHADAVRELIDGKRWMVLSG